MIGDTNVDVFDHSAPDLPQLSILLPSVHGSRQQGKPFSLLAQDPAETFLDASKVLLFALLVHSCDISSRQTIFFHQLDQIEVVLSQLPCFKIAWTILLLVLDVNGALVCLVFPQIEGTANVSHRHVFERGSHLGLPCVAPVFP